MSVLVYHGGTPFKPSFKRDFEATNGGSLGYYVTRSHQQATGYGPVYTYQLALKHDSAKHRLTRQEAATLSRLTRYWENFTEVPNNAEAINALLDCDSVYSAALECINTTGQIDLVIGYLASLDYNYTTTDDPNVLIAWDGLQLVSNS